MSAQLEIDLASLPAIVAAPRTGSLDERFDAFCDANPQLVARFDQLALDEVRRGHKRVGAKMLLEVIRFYYRRDHAVGDTWSVNNSYSSRLARRAAERYPELRDVFETRALRSGRAA